MAVTPKPAARRKGDTPPDTILPTQPGWTHLTLATPSGARVLNAPSEPGAPPAPIGERASFEKVLATGRPAVRPITLDEQNGRYELGARVPVVRQGETRYVLSAAVDPRKIRALVREAEAKKAAD